MKPTKRKNKVLRVEPTKKLKPISLTFNIGYPEEVYLPC
jgi:hypothetical protein